MGDRFQWYKMALLTKESPVNGLSIMLCRPCGQYYFKSRSVFCEAKGGNGNGGVQTFENNLRL